MQRFLTRKEAMKVLNISSKDTMRKLMKEPGFPTYKIGGVIRIGEDELEEWIQKQKLRNK